MASDLRGYSADEVLNKVLNTSNDSIQVDIVTYQLRLPVLQSNSDIVIYTSVL